MTKKCLDHVLASPYLLPEPSTPNTRGWLEEHYILSADRTKPFLHHCQSRIRIISSNPSIETRQIRPTEELDLSLSDGSAVNLGLANSHRAVDRPVGILHADRQTRPHRLTSMDPRNGANGRVVEILYSVSQSILVPQTLRIANTDDLSLRTLQTCVEPRCFTFPLRFFQYNSLEAHFLEGPPGLCCGPVRRRTVNHDKLDLLSWIIDLGEVAELLLYHWALVVCWDDDADSWFPFLGEVKAVASRRGQSPHYAKVCEGNPDMEEANEDPGNEDKVDQENSSSLRMPPCREAISGLSRRETLNPSRSYPVTS